MGDKLNLDSVLQSELKTIIDTENNLRGSIVLFEDATNILFKLPYYLKAGSNDPASFLGKFEYFCSMHYYQAPYTFLSIYHLWKKGYYYECVILLRHLLESFVQMRYFNDHINEIDSYINQPKKRKSFKTMFNFIAPGLYDDFYSLLSNFAHGGLSKDLLRTEQYTQKSADHKVILGCQYNENNATFAFNIINALLLGYYKYFIFFFPESKREIENDVSMRGDYHRNISNILSAVESHKKCNPKSEEWYKLILPLVN